MPPRPPAKKAKPDPLELAAKETRALFDRHTLYFGNRAYSSWSLRSWLPFKVAAAAASATGAEVLVDLEGAGRAYGTHKTCSPTGKVPALSVASTSPGQPDVTVWDSLAINEYLSELVPAAKLWPADRAARAVARSVAAEMHSGFGALRAHMPMNTRKQDPRGGMADGVREDIDRICALWADCREQFGEKHVGGGPFLFGHFTIADAMYAPVVLRFATYHPKLTAVAEAYCKAVREMPYVVQWCADAETESHRIDQYEATK